MTNEEFEKKYRMTYEVVNHSDIKDYETGKILMEMNSYENDYYSIVEMDEDEYGDVWDEFNNVDDMKAEYERLRKKLVKESIDKS